MPSAPAGSLPSRLPYHPPCPAVCLLRLPTACLPITAMPYLQACLTVPPHTTPRPPPPPTSCLCCLTPSASQDTFGSPPRTSVARQILGAAAGDQKNKHSTPRCRFLPHLPLSYRLDAGPLPYKNSRRACKLHSVCVYCLAASRHGANSLFWRLCCLRAIARTLLSMNAITVRH